MMTRHTCLVLLTLSAPIGALAQTTTPSQVSAHWGAVHRAPGQALAVNWTVPDGPEFGDPIAVATRLRLVDADGKLLYEKTVESMSGQAVSVVVAGDVRAAMKTIPGDIYAFIDPNVRLALASLEMTSLDPRVVLSPKRLVPTLEVMEISSGRVTGLASPRLIVPDGPE